MYSDEEWGEAWLEAMRRVAEYDTIRLDVVIEGGDVGLPRASSIGICSRQQWYRLTDTPKTDVLTPMHNWSAWMGWAGQELVVTILREMGYTVSVPPLGIVRDVLSVHPDGEISGLDLGDEVVLWDGKVRNAYGYKSLLKGRMRAVDPPMYLQMQVGMEAQGRDKCVVTLHPHDLSTTTLELKKYKLDGKVHNAVAHRLWVERDVEAQQLAVDRATALITASSLNLMVNREANPAKDRFPCGFCPWRARCPEDDADATMTVPEIPVAWSLETDDE